MRRLMFIATSRRKSPSTGNLAMTSRNRVISGSVRSLTCVVGSTPAALQVACARLRPMPKMCINAIPTCLLVGMLTPAIRAILLFLYPWRCLCRGSSQITRTTPRRRTILHLRQIFLTEAITFINSSLLRSKRYPTLGEVVRRHLHRHLVAGQDADVIHPHLAGDEGMDRVPV